MHRNPVHIVALFQVAASKIAAIKDEFADVLEGDVLGCTGFVLRPTEDDDETDDGVTWMFECHGVAVGDSPFGNLSVRIALALEPGITWGEAVEVVAKSYLDGSIE